MLCDVTPVNKPEFPGFGGGRPEVTPPIQLPSLPGIWPKPGEPSLPIVLPPDLWPPSPDRPSVSPPIHIPEKPDKPFPKPPGVIWPPLPPDLGLEGKVAILIWVVGVGFRWYIYEAPSVGGGPIVPEPPTPK